MNLDLHRLEVLCKVIETRSFTKAGERMFLSQPTISEHIRYLEEVVGEKLINRMGREAIPTQAGMILYEYAKRMLDLRHRAIQALENFRGVVAGHLFIGASTIPGNYILPEIVGKFRTSFPSISMTITISDSKSVVDMLLSGRIEMGFTGATWHDIRLAWQEIWRDTLVLAVKASDPLSLKGTIEIEEIGDIPLIFREKGSGTRKVTEEVLSHFNIDLDKLKIVAEFGSTEAVRQGIKAGIGASIISYRAVEEDVDRGSIAMIEIRNLKIERPFYIVTHKRHHLSPIARTFRDFVMSSFNHFGA
ncbi:MAG: selenium metabolism-associated LysR family transcriptional regulator [Syntrophobacterales bacterium]|nr:selenium metabolism-associated LysR family transcriptional regulator [Syntrophobacterales bacterium]